MACVLRAAHHGLGTGFGRRAHRQYGPTASSMERGVCCLRQDIVVANGRIAAIRPSTGPLPADGIALPGRTVLPGFIDTHVHLGWYLNAQHRLHQNRDGDSPATSAFNHAANAWATLRARIHHRTEYW